MVSDTYPTPFPPRRFRVSLLTCDSLQGDLCGDAHTGVILYDLLSIGAGRKSGHTTSVGSRAWQPGEFRKLTESLGFDSFRWAPYGRPRSIDGEPALKRGPISSIATSGNVNLLHYRGEWATWECEFRKPR